MKNSEVKLLIKEKSELEERLRKVNELLQLSLDGIFVKIYKKYGWDIREKSRYSELVSARNEFFYLARERSFTLCEIGNYLGFNHATVLHGIKNHKRKIKC